jgi:gluconokinase
MQNFVVMGVSGCGKTSVGEALAAELGLRFVDGDALHPESNIKKMSSGIPLDDHDRAPWLVKVGATLAETDGPAVVGCSSLKRKYRDTIRENAGGDVGFIHLYADKDILVARVNEREGHFMPPALLDSQYADLEHLEADESGAIVDISVPLAEVVAKAKTYIRENLS